MLRDCDNCGNPYEAKTARSKFCKTACRVSNSRALSPPDGGDSENSLVKATRVELAAADKVNTMLGQQALALAARMSGRDSGGGVASLSKELSRVMAAAIGTPTGAAAVLTDSVDELRARRNAKRAG